MLEQIDFDKIFNLQVFQYLKWVTGFVVLIGILYLIYDLHTTKLEVQAEKKDHAWTITAIKKVLYDTRAEDATLLKMIEEFLEKKRD